MKRIGGLPISPLPLFFLWFPLELAVCTHTIHARLPIASSPSCCLAPLKMWASLRSHARWWELTETQSCLDGELLVYLLPGYPHDSTPTLQDHRFDFKNA
ncbi:hypothetical protein BX600DRAFT_470796 [Xylariales sp. PMI_506]|nr:hypothetical protein BX600DRAFT_470796 [Xylariales sp. PMI_506]